MGAESSSLEECSFESPIVTGTDSQWEVKHGITFENDTEITVFTDKSKKKDSCLPFERNVKFLRSLRHPHILHYIRDGTDGNRYVVTERATPLSLVLTDLSPIEVASGICNIISALSFLHDKANICHNNVCIDTVYVTGNGHWKLAGFECACRLTEVTQEFLKSTSRIRNENSIAPEESDGSVNLTPEFGHVRDVYSFGVMVDSLLEYLEDLEDIIKTFELRIQDECLNTDPKRRPKLHTFLEDKIFSNDLLYMSSFLHHITLKSTEEREEFYRTLLPSVHSLPEETVGKHLVQPLLCRFVLLDKIARENVAPHILTPKREYKNQRHCVKMDVTPLFSEEVFRRYVIPELYKAFCCHEINIRTVLLKYFQYYADLFDKEKLEDVIFPQILLGIRDKSEEIAALSLHCLADLVPILGRDVVIGGRSKTYFVEGLPKNFNSSHPEKEPVSNVNGVIGKVKLKDLALLSKQTGETKQNTHTDRKGREERMKEAREKREQKRLERQNKKNTLIKASSSEKTESVENVPNVIPTDNFNSENIHSNSFVSRHIDENHDGNIPQEMTVQPDVFCEDRDDWSDWDDENESTDDILTNSSHDHTSLVIDSNVPMETKLTHSSGHLHSPRTSNSINDEKSLWLSDSPDRTFDMETQNDGKRGSVSGKKVMSLKGKAKTIKPKSSEPLGAEFDIHNIEIKLKSEAVKEEDFFADMMPDIKPSTPKDGMSNFNISKSPGSGSKTEKSSMFSFSYTETEADKVTSGTGWDNDGWDVDGF